MKVKICGITTMDDALMVTDAGADLIGLNFYRPSPRYIAPQMAREICTELREQLGEYRPALVGVFVNATVGEITHIIGQAGLDFAQLSGDETIDMLAELRGVGFKAIRPLNAQLARMDVDYFKGYTPQSERAPSLLLDAYHPKLYGGTGEAASVEVAELVKDQVPRLMLAGGLKPHNVAERVDAIQPWGVDVASGVEDNNPGIKNPDKVWDFIQAAKDASI